MRRWKRADFYRHEAENGRRRERRLRRDNRTLREKLQLLERATEGERRDLLVQLSRAEEGLRGGESTTCSNFLHSATLAPARPDHPGAPQY